jgi:hypothetical protein
VIVAVVEAGRATILRLKVMVLATAIAVAVAAEAGRMVD